MCSKIIKTTKAIIVSKLLVSFFLFAPSTASAQSVRELAAQIIGHVANSPDCNLNVRFQDGRTGHVCDFNQFMKMLFVTGRAPLSAPFGSMSLRLHHENRKGSNTISYRIGPNASDNPLKTDKLGIWKTPEYRGAQIKIKMNDFSLDEYSPRPAYPRILAKIGFEEVGTEIETELCNGTCRDVDDYRIPDVHLNNAEGRLEITFRENSRLMVESVCASDFRVRVAIRGQIDIGDRVANVVNSKLNSCKTYESLKNSINKRLDGAFSDSLVTKMFGAPYVKDKKLIFLKPKS